MRRSLPVRRGLSLIELLVVIGIVTLLIGLTASAVQKARSSASRTQCANNLRQLGIALHQYHDRHRAFPPGCSSPKRGQPYPHMGWATRLLPDLEQGALWAESVRAFEQERFFEAPPHKPILGTVLRPVVCPADAPAREPKVFSQFSVGLTSYLGVSGQDVFRRDGVLYFTSAVSVADITDGASNTLIVGERPASRDGTLGWWYAGWGINGLGTGDVHLGVRESNTISSLADCPPGPYSFGPANAANRNCDSLHFWSPHSGGAHFLFADGSVRFLPYSANPIMPALATRAGGEVVAVPD